MKEEVIRIRVTAEFKKEIEKEAEKLNISLSAYVRMKISKEHERNLQRHS